MPKCSSELCEDGGSGGLKLREPGELRNDVARIAQRVLLDQTLDFARSDVRSAACCFHDGFADVKYAELTNAAGEADVPIRIKSVGNHASAEFFAFRYALHQNPGADIRARRQIRSRCRRFGWLRW